MTEPLRRYDVTVTVDRYGGYLPVKLTPEAP